MNLKVKSILTVSTTLLIIGCGGGGGTGGSGGGTGGGTSSSKNITITEENQVNSLGKDNKIKATIDIGNTPKSLYILLSNYDKSNFASTAITHTAKVQPSISNKTTSSPFSTVNLAEILHTPIHIQRFNANGKYLLKKNHPNKYQTKRISSFSKIEKNVGDSETFYMDETSSGKKTVATLKKIVSNISTSSGNKTLNVWVSDDSYDNGSGCSKSKCVTQSMVEELADTFLQTGSDNDIYDWVTNIYGEEWGDAARSKYNNVIAANNEITILLTDIDNDNNKDGGTIGYFYGKDNYTSSTYSGSNQRIMFYIDTVMFANNEGGDFWKKEIYSTLAHEFQHMIHFYQKTVLLEASDDIWINEMLSEATEDLIATKIRHTGPRGVDPDDGSAGETGNTKGRYPDFNRNTSSSLTSWNNGYGDYAKVNAFGTFLTRNYGGAKILHDIMHNNKEHEDAIEKATEEKFDNLLKQWGIAIILSDKEGPEDAPVYNTGDFTYDDYRSSTYDLGSINFFNYSPTLIAKTTAGTVAPQGNYYYKIGDNLTGIVNIDLTLNGSTEATLIAK